MIHNRDQSKAKNPFMNQPPILIWVSFFDNIFAVCSRYTFHDYITKYTGREVLEGIIDKFQAY